MNNEEPDPSGNIEPGETEADGAKKPGWLSRSIDALLWAASIGVLMVAVWPNNSGPQTDEPAPVVSVALLNEEGSVDIGGATGKPVLIEAFASWCGACKRNRGLFNSLAPLVAAGKIDAIAVSVDSERAAALAAMKSWPIEGKVAHDSNGAFSREYSVSVLPTYIFIDEKGQVQDVSTGGVSPSTLSNWLGNLGESASVNLDD